MCSVTYLLFWDNLHIQQNRWFFYAKLRQYSFSLQVILLENLKKSETYAGVLRKDIKSKLNGHFVWESFQTICKILTNCNVCFNQILMLHCYSEPCQPRVSKIITFKFNCKYMYTQFWWLWNKTSYHFPKKTRVKNSNSIF